MILSFLNVLIGLVLSNVGYVLTRDKLSGGSPTKFSFSFWIKDNWAKIAHSIVIAVGLNLALQLNLKDIEGALGLKWYGIYAIAIGFFPDAILVFLKDKLGWFTSKTVTVKGKEYERK